MRLVAHGPDAEGERVMVAWVLSPCQSDGVRGVFERSPGWAPWEQHPDPRRSVGSVLDGRGVIAATTSARVGVALTKAVLDTDTRSCGKGPRGRVLTSTNEVVPASLRTTRDPDTTCQEVMP